MSALSFRAGLAVALALASAGTLAQGKVPSTADALFSALDYRGYEARLEIGDGGHSLVHGGAIFPDSLRWLWQPAPVRPPSEAN